MAAMTTTLYGIKACDTCRKARRLLDAQGVDYRYHDLREDGLTRAHLDAFLSRVEWQALLNTRSTTWRQLAPTDKEGLDEARAIALMLAHPTLLKRPVLESANELIVGLDTARYDAL